MTRPLKWVHLCCTGFTFARNCRPLHSGRPAAAAQVPPPRPWTSSSSLQISSFCVADKITTLNHTQLASNLAESCVDTDCQCSPTQRQVGLVVKCHMRQRSQFDTLNCDGWWRTIPQMKAIAKNLRSMQCKSAAVQDVSFCAIKGTGSPRKAKPPPLTKKTKVGC